MFKIKISNHNHQRAKQKLVTAVKDFRMDVCYQATIRFDRIKFLQDQTPQPRLLPFWLQNPEELILNFQFQEELT